MGDPAGATPDVRYVVRRGGAPTPEQVAALTVALAPVPGAAAGDERDQRGGRGGPPAWTRAALHEGLGGAPVTSAPDLIGLSPHRRPLTLGRLAPPAGGSW